MQKFPLSVRGGASGSPTAFATLMLRVASLTCCLLCVAAHAAPSGRAAAAAPDTTDAAVPREAPSAVDRPAETTADDAVTRFLAEKGLLDAGSPAGTADPGQVEPADSKGLRQRVSDTASELVLTAMNFLGVPYRRGGQSAQHGFDCSGFTRYIFENSVGLVLPRRAEEQARAPGFLPVDKQELKPGDLVFFNTLRHAFSHVGIYVGDNKFIHSPRTGGEVRVEDMRMAYWTQRYNGARRVLGREAVKPVTEAVRATAVPTAQ